MLRATYTKTPRCVVCATLLTGEQVQAALDIGLAPCCPDHALLVELELMTADRAWPTTWFGGWIKRNGQWAQESEDAIQPRLIP